MRRSRQSNQGSALLLATLFLFVAILLMSAIAMRVVRHKRHVDAYEEFTECFTGAEAGISAAKLSIETGGDGAIGLGSWTPADAGETPFPDLNDERLTPSEIGLPPITRYAAYTINWSDDDVDNNGDGVIDGANEQWTYTIYSVANCGATTRWLETIYRGMNVNVWQNAIFGGTGQIGGLINGNVSIHGSVHLLGNNILEGGVAVTALDLSGTSLIHNNYTGMPAALASRVPALPTASFGGKNVYTLEAKLRVKNGLVGLSGNSEIGEPDSALNTIKETMDGTYVNDGWTGTAVVDDGNRGDPKSVYSDNGWDEVYDLGDRVPFPILDDDWRDPVTGAGVLYTTGTRNYQHDEYFTEKLAGAAYTGNMTIDTSTNFYYNATRPADADPTHRTSTDDYVYFNASTNKMEINGQIVINGDLEMKGKGNDTTIYYTGRAAFLVNGNVSLDTNLLTVNSDGSTANSFPVKNIIGIMARNSMVVGSTAQLTLMGAFYAQNTVKSTKQTITIGTFVSNYFDMGTNVPEIYQVPELADNLPLGMIGGLSDSLP